MFVTGAIMMVGMMTPSAAPRIPLRHRQPQATAAGAALRSNRPVRRRLSGGVDQIQLDRDRPATDARGDREAITLGPKKPTHDYDIVGGPYSGILIDDARHGRHRGRYTMADSRDGKSFWHTLPGVLTAVGGFLTALTGLLVTLDQLGLIGAAPKSPPALVAPGLSSIQIAGRWEDDDGTVYQIVQDGESFTFTGENPAFAMWSEGSGRLSGRSFTTRFVVNDSYPGEGSGDVSADGRRMSGTFQDHLSGSYQLSFQRR